MLNKLRPGSSTKENRGCGVLLGLFFLFAAIPGLILSIRNLPEYPEGFWLESGTTILCTSLAVILGLVVIGASVIPWIAEWRMGTPDVSIRGRSVRPGDTISVEYSQTFKKTADVRGISVTLLKRERATYSDGSSYTTVTHEETGASFALPGRVYEAGERLDFSRGAQIPRDGMHTFKAKYNRITWLLHVKVEIAQWPDYSEYFEIQVQPVWAA